MRHALAFFVFIVGIASTARAEDNLFRPVSAAPADILSVPQSQPLGGFSLAAGLFTQVGHRPAAGSAQESYRVGTDVLLSASLFGYLQLDLSLPARLGFSIPSSGPTTAGAALEPLRAGGKIVLPGLRRDPTDTGTGVALTFSADLPTGVNASYPLAYVPGLVVDYRFSWIYFSAYSAVPFHIADDGAPLAVDVTVGGGLAARLCGSCGVSAGAIVDGSIRVTNPGDGPRVRARGAIFGQIETDSGWFFRLWGGIPLDGYAASAVTAGINAGVVFGPGKDSIWGWAAKRKQNQIGGTLLADAGVRRTDAAGIIPDRSRDDLAAGILGSELTLRQLEQSGWISPRYQATLDFLHEHFNRMADLLAGADEHPEDAPALYRSISLGLNLGVYAIDLLIADISWSVGWVRKTRLDWALRWCWEGIRNLRDNPFWVDDDPKEAQKILREADFFHEKNVDAEKRSAIGKAGVDAASIIGGAASMARVAGELPQAWLMTRAELSRLAAAIGRALGGGPGEVGGALLVTPEGTIVMGVIRAHVPAVISTVELTEAEIRALVALQRLPVIALQLRRAGETPAQEARRRGLSGSNSVGGGWKGGTPSTQQWDTSANAKILRRNLEGKGVKFGKNDQAHHLVPSTHRAAEPAREILDRFGIDINSVENGIVLPARRHHGRGLHTIDEIDRLVGRIRAAVKDGRQGVLDILERVRQEIQAKP